MKRTKEGRGFSLIEAAIVLAIVGLVIGGIWIAASSVMKKQRVPEFIKLYTVAKERARLGRHITPSGLFPDAQTMLAGRGVPPSFKPSGISTHVYEGNGMWVRFYMDGSSFQTYVFFYNEPAGAARATNPELCIGVLNFLNEEYKRGAPPIGQNVAIYTRSVVNGNAIDGGDSSTPFPTDFLTFAEIQDLCTQSSSVDLRQAS